MVYSYIIRALVGLRTLFITLPSWRRKQILLVVFHDMMFHDMGLFSDSSYYALLLILQRRGQESPRTASNVRTKLLFLWFGTCRDAYIATRTILLLYVSTYMTVFMHSCRYTNGLTGVASQHFAFLAFGKRVASSVSA